MSHRCKDSAFNRGTLAECRPCPSTKSFGDARLKAVASLQLTRKCRSYADKINPGLIEEMGLER